MGVAGRGRRAVEGRVGRSAGDLCGSALSGGAEGSLGRRGRSGGRGIVREALTRVCPVLVCVCGTVACGGRVCLAGEGLLRWSWRAALLVVARPCVTCQLVVMAGGGGGVVGVGDKVGGELDFGPKIVRGTYSPVEGRGWAAWRGDMWVGLVFHHGCDVGNRACGGMDIPR